MTDRDEHDIDARFAAAADDVASDPEVSQLVEDIEETRGEMTSTVEEIGERLDPKNIVAGAKETVREATVGKVEDMANTAGEMVRDAGQTAQQAGSGFVDTIRRNPVPAALAGIGIGWLALSARSGQSRQEWRGATYPSGSGFAGSSYGERYGAERSWETSRMGERGTGEGIGGAVSQAQHSAGEVVGQVQERAGQVVGQVQERAGQVVDQVGSTAEQVPHQVQGAARQVTDNAGRMYHDNPLAFGAIAVAVGTALGMALPVTRTEQQVLGQASSQVIGKAEEAASHALEQAEQQVRASGRDTRYERQMAEDTEASFRR